MWGRSCLPLQARRGPRPSSRPWRADGQIPLARGGREVGRREGREGPPGERGPAASARAIPRRSWNLCRGQGQSRKAGLTPAPNSPPLGGLRGLCRSEVRAQGMEKDDMYEKKNFFLDNRNTHIPFRRLGQRHSETISVSRDLVW